MGTSLVRRCPKVETPVLIRLPEKNHNTEILLNQFLNSIWFSNFTNSSSEEKLSYTRNGGVHSSS